MILVQDHKFLICFLNSVAINSIVTSIGFTWECLGNSVDNTCQWSGGEYGCIGYYRRFNYRFELKGVYPITILFDVVAEYVIFGLPVPIEVTDDTFADNFVLIINNNDNAGCTDSDSFNYNPSNRR